MLLGAAIELKRDKARATPEQKKWREQLLESGYRSVICKGREACLEEIRSYFQEDGQWQHDGLLIRSPGHCGCAGSALGFD